MTTLGVAAAGPEPANGEGYRASRPAPLRLRLKGTGMTWDSLRARIVTACGSTTPTVASSAMPPAYRDALATFGAGTFDDVFTLLPPEHVQRWSERMGALLAEDRMPPELRDLAIFGEDIDGRMVCFDGEGVTVVDGFRCVRANDLLALVVRSLQVEGRRRSWFRPYGKYLLLHAEALLDGAGEQLDPWMAARIEGDHAVLLASRGRDGGGKVHVRELMLPSLDGVLRLQVVGKRCSLRLSLPRDADVEGALRALKAPAPWETLVSSARPKVVG